MNSAKILIINGPNMNLLGKREPDIYSTHTLQAVNSNIQSYAAGMKFTCEFFQSNYEGAIIDRIQDSDTYDGCIINAAAYTHYSYAIRDAISAVKKPFVEVHMSNIFARDDFRHTSVISAVCKGTICGFGENSYLLAVSALRDIIK